MSNRGDTESAFASAPVQVDETYVTPVETHNPMEMHATVAVWDGKKYTLYESSQGVMNHQNVLSQVLGEPQGKCRGDLAVYRLGIWRQALPVAAFGDCGGRFAEAQSAGEVHSQPQA